jgi:hypothetical protein
MSHPPPDHGADDAPRQPPERGSAHPRNSGDPWSITAYLLSGMLIWGGAGWLLDRSLGTAFLLPGGLPGGAVLALYLIYVRFGSS